MKKIVDEKGRIFGVVNIIDLIVILLVIAVAFAVVMKVSDSKAARAEEEAELLAEEEAAKSLDYPIPENYELAPIKYTVICRQVNNKIADEIETVVVGQELMAGAKYVRGCKVTAVERSTFYETYVTPEGEPKKIESQEYCDLTFTIEGMAPFNGCTFQVGSQEVRLGKSHIVKTASMELTGAVMKLEGING